MRDYENARAGRGERRQRFVNERPDSNGYSIERLCAVARDITRGIEEACHDVVIGEEPLAVASSLVWTEGNLAKPIIDYRLDSKACAKYLSGVKGAAVWTGKDPVEFQALRDHAVTSRLCKPYAIVCEVRPFRRPLNAVLPIPFSLPMPQKVDLHTSDTRPPTPNSQLSTLHSIVPHLWFQTGQNTPPAMPRRLAAGTGPQYRLS